jgi:cyclic pyranopterin phosphate synthase
MKKPGRGPALSHVDARGQARMVDVSAKPVTRRHAVAEGFVVMRPATLRVLQRGQAPKGEVLGTARLAGIMAAKRTGELIPLCHPLPVEQVTVDFAVPARATRGAARVRIVATATLAAKTGVEMEALVAVSVAGLTVIDMLKAVDPHLRLEGIRVIEKRGGQHDFAL